MTNSSLLEKFQKATFSHAYIFSSILSENKDITKEIIELFNPSIKIKEIKQISAEKMLQETFLNKYIRMDILIELDDGTLVNIEMQNDNKDNIPKRLRYYSSIITTNSLPKGKHYTFLPSVLIMMICSFDLFNHNKPIYTFTMNTSDKDNPTHLEDELKIQVINVSGHLDNLSVDQKAFLKYIKDGVVSTPLTRKIDAKIKELKEKEYGRIGFMKYELDMQDSYYSGLSVGEKKGIEKERKINIISFFKTLINLDFNYDDAVKTIANSRDIPETEIRKIIESSNKVA